MSEQQPTEERFQAMRELRRLGVSEFEIQRLLTAFPLEIVSRQLRWLRLRKVWKPSAFIVAAITHDYGPPAALFEEGALNSMESAANSNSDNSSDSRGDSI